MNHLKVTNPFYGARHSKKYSGQSFDSFLSSRDDKKRIVKVHSDAYLLLRQENLHEKIGVESLRRYIDSMQHPVRDTPDLTDDELFQLIEPRGINTITDAYQYSRFIQSNADDIKGKYNKLVETKTRFNNALKND